MDNAQKAIMIGVGLFITIIIIAAVMLITGMGQDLLNSGTKKLSGVSTQLQAQITSEYDNKQFSGAQVLAAIQGFYNEPDLAIAVNNNSKGVDGIAGTPCIKDNDNNSVIWTTSRAIGKGTNVSMLTAPTNNRIVAVDGTIVNPYRPSYGAFTSYDTNDKDERIVVTGQYRSYLIELNNTVLGIFFVRVI